MSPSRTTQAVTFLNGKNKSEITCYFWFFSDYCKSESYDSYSHCCNSYC